MKVTNKKRYSIVLLSTMVFLHGCTGSNLTDSQPQNQPVDKPEVRVASTPVLKPVPLESRSKEKSIEYGNEPDMAVQEVATVSSISNSSLSHPQQIQPSVKMARKTMVGGAYAPNVSYLQDDTLAVPSPYPGLQRESYDTIKENPFIATTNDPLSTFSIDVDTASYANVRRFLTGGTLPPVGAVRLEEMVNYFTYQYPEPQNHPVSITTEVGPCPWQPEHKLVRIGLKAKELNAEQLPPSNLVFLIDVSGSMNQANKLPLLKQSMLLLTNKLTPRDRVSIVVYAGADRVVLTPTAGDMKSQIKKAITTLSSGGSTHASSGILTAYKLARQSFMPSGNNRIILASDGDFNVGVTSRGELERLVAKERESGIYLTVLGFGMGNYHDDTMEILADKGNGNYSYIDSLLEAKKVLIKERSGTLFTLAKDVKLQIEFNPVKVGGYRLIGYENRALADEDFNNDKKDAGEIGAGHTVTALYEILPVGSDKIPSVDPLKYQSVSASAVESTSSSAELLTVKLRYKPLHSSTSQLLSQAVTDNDRELKATSDDFRFASTVAGFGMLLRHSEHVEKLSYSQLIAMAKTSRGKDEEGYRAEFIRLLEMADLLTVK